MNIQELFKKEQQYWEKENKELFGLVPINQFELVTSIQEKLDKCCEEYWNGTNPCLFATALIEKLDKDSEKRVPNTFRLEYNYLNTCVDIYQTYVHNKKEQEFKVACIPSVSDELSWLMGNLHYVPRITALKNNRNFICRFNDEKVFGEKWVYNIVEDDFTYYHSDIQDEKQAFNQLSDRSLRILKMIDENVNENTFRQTLRQVPMMEHNSVFNYIYSRMEYFKDLILNTVKYAQPTKKVLLGINSLLLSQAKTYTTSGEKYEGSLTLSKNKLFSLENFRTTINIFNGSFKPTFYYVDSIGLFDSFKTVTTGQAGRQRLLLDNVIVKDGMLYIEENGKLNDMYHYLYEPQSLRLSCLSEAPFCNNDKPKRIMMNAKLTAQSVPLQDEIDNLTHRVLARVGFADLEGYSYGDSIIISESFAKKLLTYNQDTVVVSNEVFNELNEDLTFVNLEKIFPTKHEAILMNMENPKIIRVEDLGSYKRLLVKWNIPFRLGDKITNLHGAKGTVGLILPDEEMPILQNQVGNMEAGPLEVIISGFSTMRRGSLGQIFEAWSEASGIEIPYGQDYIAKVIEKYSDEMKVFSENSIVTYKGEQTIMPVGYNRIMRIDQHASAKCSTSTRHSTKKLKLGEMEKLNLVSNDCPHILKEISLRDLNKNVGGLYLLNELENTGKLPKHNQIVLQTATLFRTLGYDLKVDGRSIERSDYSQMDMVLEDIFNGELEDDEITN